MPDRQGELNGRDREDLSAIRENIRRTRAEMCTTVNQLQTRLAPQHIKEEISERVHEKVEHAKESVRQATIGRAETFARKAGDTVSEVRHGILDTIRDNPIPAAMVGIGLGWLIMNRSHGSSDRSTRQFNTYDDRSNNYWPQTSGRYGGSNYTGQSYGGYTRRSAFSDQSPTANFEGGYREQHDSGVQGRVEDLREGVSERAHEMMNKVESVRDDVGEKLGEVRESVSEHAREFAHGAREQVSEITHQVLRVEDRVTNVISDNPVGAAAVMMAAGLAVGLAIPRTRREDELLGGVRDGLVDRASGLVHEGVERVHHLAETRLEGETDERNTGSSGFGSGTFDSQRTGYSAGSSNLGSSNFSSASRDSLSSDRTFSGSSNLSSSDRDVSTKDNALGNDRDRSSSSTGSGYTGSSNTGSSTGSRSTGSGAGSTLGREGTTSKEKNTDKNTGNSGGTI